MGALGLGVVGVVVGYIMLYSMLHIMLHIILCIMLMGGTPAQGLPPLRFLFFLLFIITPPL